MDSAPLLATLAALLCGPLLYGLGRRQPALLVFLDGFVLVSVAGLVLFDVMPDSVALGGPWSFVFLILGAIGPAVVERGLDHARREAHLATLALAVFGLLLHSVADGAALAPGHSPHHGHDTAGHALALAIVVHSVPVGLVVWWVMSPVFGWRLPSIILGLMALATVGGYLFGLGLEEQIGGQPFAWFQALVAGSILHVVFGRPHLEEDSGFRKTRPPFEGLGNLAALMGLYLLHRIDAHDERVSGMWRDMWDSLAAIAPWYFLACAVLLVFGRSKAGFRAATTITFAFLLSWSLLGLSLSLAWLAVVAVLVVFRQQAIPSFPGGPSALQGLHQWTDLTAPPVLFGLGVGALLGMAWPYEAAQWPAAPWLIGIAAVLPLLLGWNLLVMIPLAAATGALGLADGAQLALMIAAGFGGKDDWPSKLVRSGVAALAGAMFWYFEPTRFGAVQLSSPTAVPVLMLGCFGLALLASGGRRWAGQVGGHSHVHAH